MCRGCEGRHRAATDNKSLHLCHASGATPTDRGAFVSVAKVVTPFLTMYQTDRPMVPFLASDIHRLLVQLLVRFMKTETIENMTLAQILDVKMEDRLV